MRTEHLAALVLSGMALHLLMMHLLIRSAPC